MVLGSVDQYNICTYTAEIFLVSFLSVLYGVNSDVLTFVRIYEENFVHMILLLLSHLPVWYWKATMINFVIENIIIVQVSVFVIALQFS